MDNAMDRFDRLGAPRSSKIGLRSRGRHPRVPRLAAGKVRENDAELRADKARAGQLCNAEYRLSARSR